MSLRARLMLGLLALAAVGLVVVDVVSYVALRSNLYQRVDQQVASAIAPVGRALFSSPGGSVRAGPGFPSPPPDAPEEPFGGAPPPGEPPDELHLPPGTYGALLSSGRVVRRVPFSYGEKGLPRPVLPAEPPLSPGPDSLNTFTVPASAGSSGFRVAALRPPGSSRTLVVAIPLGDTDQTLSHVRLVGAIVTAAVLAALAGLAWWVIGVGLQPLRRMTGTANEIAEGDDLSLRVTTTDERTEVGRMGAAFNGMLAKIEDAFAKREASEDRMRRFLADASHELRTPLASIRGYSELFRLGADADPDALRTAMRRIEDESTRMGTIVNDLLTLARLDEVREPVRESVDLTEVAADAAHDARTSAPDRLIRLDVDDGGRGTEVEADGDQLRQVAANLLSNAIAHTPAGTSIEVAIEAGDSDVAIAVRDHGPGLPPEEASRVFERFYSERHGEPRDPNGSGSGLGLAIVAAVAEAHGGRAEAVNAEGGGAIFSVTLPRRATVEAEAAAPRS
jgi:two-component system OmpR family sensor kinase